MSSYEVRLVKNKQKTFTSNKDFICFRSQKGRIFSNLAFSWIFTGRLVQLSVNNVYCNSKPFLYSVIPHFMNQYTYVCLSLPIYITSASYPIDFKLQKKRKLIPISRLWLLSIIKLCHIQSAVVPRHICILSQVTLIYNKRVFNFSSAEGIFAS